MQTRPASPPAARPLAPPPASVQADYRRSDADSAQPVRVLSLNGQLLIQGDGLDLSLPLRGLQWPRRQGAQRRLVLPAGASLTASDPIAWDRWQRRVGPGAGWRELRLAGLLVLLTLALLAGVGWAGYRHGLPGLAGVILQWVPPELEQRIGRATLEGMDAESLAPSNLPDARRQALEARVAEAVRRAGTSLSFDLQWRRSRDGKTPGPNAFALPGGTVVVTDELVQLLEGADDALLGVIGHELGHVQQRHGMRLLTQTGLLALAVGTVVGDYTSLITGAPLLLAQSDYSREFEREADDAAIALLQANGLSPLVMLTLFERLATLPEYRQAQESAKGWGIAIASHPPDQERIARFRAAAGDPSPSVRAP